LRRTFYAQIERASFRTAWTLCRRSTFAAKCQIQTHASQQTNPYSITSSARASSVGGTSREVELGRLLDRKIGGLRPPQNLVDQVAGAPLKSMKATVPTGVENSYFS
jgi:hypothetical protein